MPTREEFKTKSNNQMKNFSCYNKNRTDCLAASGGVTILIKDFLYSQEINLNTEIEAVAALVATENTTVCICNIYLSDRYKLSPDSLDELIQQLPQPSVLLVDFNSHSIIWGSYKTDQRGEIVE